MQRQRKMWRADHGAQALLMVSKIQASVEQLDDEDILDLQDIFCNAAGTPLATMAEAEVSRRGLKTKQN